MTRGGKRDGAGGPVKDPSGAGKMVSFRLPPATIEAIKEAAARLDISQAEVIKLGVQALAVPPE